MERHPLNYKPEPVRDSNGGTGFLMVPDYSTVIPSDTLKALKEAVETPVISNIPLEGNTEKNSSSNPPTSE